LRKESSLKKEKDTSLTFNSNIDKKGDGNLTLPKKKKKAGHAFRGGGGVHMHWGKKAAEKSQTRGTRSGGKKTPALGEKTQQRRGSCTKQLQGGLRGGKRNVPILRDRIESKKKGIIANQEGFRKKKAAEKKKGKLPGCSIFRCEGMLKFGRKEKTRKEKFPHKGQRSKKKKRSCGTQRKG